MKEELQGFLFSDLRNTWLDNAEINVYVRKSTRYIKVNSGDSPLILPALDIATIVVSPELRRRGVCARFLEVAHEMNPYAITFVEYVVRQYLALHLLKKGYREYHNDPDSYYKIKG